MSPTPALGDYIAAAWRRRVVVVIAVVLGGVLGAVVVPMVTNNSRTYAASQRVDIKASGSEKAASAPTNTRGGSGGSGDARYADPTVMATALSSLGAKAGHLDPVGKVHTTNQAVAGLSHLSAKPVSGTTWVDLTYSDTDAGLASRVIHAYADTYVASRNKTAQAAQAAQVAALTAQADTQYKEVAAWSRQADAERQASSGHVTSALTNAQLTVATKEYQSTIASLSNARAQESLKGLPTSIAGPVIVRTTSKPTGRRVLLVAGLVLGLLVGIGAAVLLESFRRRLASSAEAEALTGLPLIGVIPASGSTRGRLAVTAKPHGAAAEGIQRTRGALQLAGLGDSVMVMSVLSAEEGEGKSTTVMNLARSISNQGSPVVVVSANMRNRTLDRFHNTMNKPGLAQLLDGATHDAKALLVEVSPNNFLLPSGQSDRNPAETFTRAILTGIFAQLAEVGIVIVDTPAALHAGEVMAIAGAADASIIVARVAHATRTGLQATALDLRRLNLRCIGVVGLGDQGWVSASPWKSIDLGPTVQQQQQRQVIETPAPPAPAKPRPRRTTSTSSTSTTRRISGE
jgi:Mrp family chromosome partitioning ATPase